ncbi:hypothetical protein [Emticicia agri]|uniref:Uncharacterized protein n=1 Tax=Emticicia agri TaxID=2492393 RepID=A0A4Q5M0E5_9BACT|nr:hypothetical protein [Emticicia agri]RYU95644.1 hypothetical protein EWM59_11060 [Emticicia agri]
MKYLLFTLIALYIISCRQTPSKVNVSKEKIVDKSIIGILPYDSTEKWAFENGKQAELTDNDFVIIEELLESRINSYNNHQQKRYNKIKAKHPEYTLRKEDFIIDLKVYKRQYVAITNSKGEKEVWVNCFCDIFNENWKKDIVIVLDGGNCYFNLKINITKGTYYDLMVNGDA